MRFNWKFILAAVLAVNLGIGTADAGLFHDMEDVGKGVAVGAAVHEGEKVVEHEAERNAAEDAGKIYSKHITNRRTIYKNMRIDHSITDKHGISNLEKMHKGLAPVDKNGKPFHIHHVIQEEPGPVAEVNQAVHQKFYRALHGLKEKGESFRNDKSLVRSFDDYRKKHWKARAKEFENAKR